jgi:probable phosphoglycerate mutase
MVHIILVRHGQTEWNREERFRGRADIPLNKVGLAQAEATGRRIFNQWKPTTVYSSPLSRAVKTAEKIAGPFDLPARMHDGLIDIHYGQWQGLTPDEVREGWPEELERWYGTPHEVHIPGGETLADTRNRAMDAVNEIISRHQNQTVVMVSHTVVNRVILLGILGLGNDRFWRLRQDTCCINRCEAEGGDFTLVSLNDTCHMHDALEIEGG